MAKEIYLPKLEELAQKYSFVISEKKNTELSNDFFFCMNHPCFEDSYPQLFQIVMSRHGGAEIFPPCRITIWLNSKGEPDDQFRLSVDLLSTTPESIEYIIDKLISDYVINKDYLQDDIGSGNE